MGVAVRKELFCRRFLICVSLGLCSGTCKLAYAENYYFTINYATAPRYETADEACHVAYDEYFATPYGQKYIPEPYKSPYPFSTTNVNNSLFVCELMYRATPTSPVGGGSKVIDMHGNTCLSGRVLNPKTGACESSTDQVSRKILGPPAAQSCTGNPINISNGNKFQEEIDYVGFSDAKATPLWFKRYYNSAERAWRYSYSDYLVIGSGSILLSFADGHSSLFSRNGASVTPELGEFGSLSKVGSTWVYTSFQNDQLIFSSVGRLIGMSYNGSVKSVGYSSDYKIITVTDSSGQMIITLDSNLPKKIEVNGVNVFYSYDTFKNLTKVSSSRSGRISSRFYHYEDINNPRLLTGITDERGVRFATWTYDTEGRAISSEHGNGAEKKSVRYNADGSSTVTNELGKQTVYRFELVQGVKRVVAIEGEPSASCPSSNSTFTYNDRGQVLTQTDAKGFTTTYTHNDRGLETSRTEATGTPQARTTTTTWHATFNLPLTVTEGGQVTSYTYDAQGRQTSRTQTAL